MARDAMLGVMVNVRERRLIERAAELSGESLSAFCRRATLERVHRIARDLHKQLKLKEEEEEEEVTA